MLPKWETILKKMLLPLDKRERVFSGNVLEDLAIFINKIINLLEIRLVPSRVRGRNPDFENVQIQNRIEKGEKFIEEARNLIKNLE